MTLCTVDAIVKGQHAQRTLLPLRTFLAELCTASVMMLSLLAVSAKFHSFVKRRSLQHCFSRHEVSPQWLLAD